MTGFPVTALGSPRASGPQHGLDRPALVHRFIGVGGLVQRELEVEHPTWGDRPRPRVRQQVLEIAPYGRDSTADRDVPVEELTDGQLRAAVGRPDVPDPAAR